jgi:hypothetical protein
VRELLGQLVELVLRALAHAFRCPAAEQHLLEHVRVPPAEPSRVDWAQGARVEQLRDQVACARRVDLNDAIVAAEAQEVARRRPGAQSRAERRLRRARSRGGDEVP